MDPSLIKAYSVKEAVRVSGLTRSHLYQLMKAGVLLKVKIGHRTLIRREDLEALIDSNLTWR